MIMTRIHHQRDEAFEILGDHLVRSVVPRRGTPYVHRCSREIYQSVAHAIEEWAATGCIGDEIAESLDLPFSQVYVALKFMRDRGCITTRFRRNYPSSNVAFEDAMIEYWALAEEQRRQDDRRT